MAPLRSAAFHAKADKDLRQAAELLEILSEDRPGDLELAREALAAKGPGLRAALRKGLKLLGRRVPVAAGRVAATLRELARD